MEEVRTTGHTPGPWEAQQQGRRLVVGCRVGTLQYLRPIRIGACAVEGYQSKTGAKRGESPRFLPFDPVDFANANLIAAAPELLAALRQAVNLMDLGTSSRAAWMADALAAIRKAEGGAS